MQLRASYANGFRAPQAFDTDMHVAFANGGVSLIRLDPALRPEFANSFSASLDYDRPAENYIYGFTASAFHTRLRDPFVLEEVGEDAEGNKEFIKRNGGASAVTGLSLEGRLNWNQLVEADLGITVQQSRYDEPVAWSATIPGTRRYLRAPNQYGYYTITLTPSLPWTFSVTGVYTGPMLVPHFGGAPGVDGDRLVTSRSFVETNLKAAYTLKVKSLKQSIQFFGGVQNVFNQYQNDFDTGPSRDSNYIYGPGRPRTFFAGIKLGMF
jgi:outer membrane receptor for ferrienterochelin and colicins